jgi:hypothetical protein
MTRSQHLDVAPASNAESSALWPLHSRFVQRLHRRYADVLPLLPAGPPTRDSLSATFAALQAAGFDTPAALRVLFQGINGKLRQPLPEVTGVEVAGEDRFFHRASARIDGDTLVVHSDTVATPVAVRYAWRNYAIAWLQDDLETSLPLSGTITPRRN